MHVWDGRGQLDRVLTLFLLFAFYLILYSLFLRISVRTFHSSHWKSFSEIKECTKSAWLHAVKPKDAELLLLFLLKPSTNIHSHDVKMRMCECVFCDGHAGVNSYDRQKNAAAVTTDWEHRTSRPSDLTKYKSIICVWNRARAFIRCCRFFCSSSSTSSSSLFSSSFYIIFLHSTDDCKVIDEWTGNAYRNVNSLFTVHTHAHTTYTYMYFVLCSKLCAYMYKQSFGSYYELLSTKKERSEEKTKENIQNLIQRQNIRYWACVRALCMLDFEKLNIAYTDEAASVKCIMAVRMKEMAWTCEVAIKTSFAGI